ncbi:MAG: hypothetical protein PHR60_06885, partial [Eubacteriales bacterium]|nr:hypothetical protein [Eubacteriales bacterium]
MVKRDSLLPGAIILALLLGTWMLFPGEAGSGSPFRGEGDLDGDGRIEEYILEDHCLTVREGERCI